MDQRLGLVREEAFAKQLGLLFEALGEWQSRGRLHRLDCLSGSEQLRRTCRYPRPHAGQCSFVGRLLAELVGTVAGPAGRLSLCQHLACESNGFREQIARDDPVDDAALLGLGRVDRVACRAHLRSPEHASQPRQPLGTAGTGNDPELDLRLPHLRGLFSDAVVTGHRQLESPTKGKAVDRTDDWLGELLQGLEQPGKRQVLAASPGRRSPCRTR